jgi:hypothetical protein
MAHDTHEESPGMTHDIGNNAITLTFAFVAGGGILLMLTALVVGVIDPNAGGVIGLLFVLGVAGMLSGIIAWIATVRPFTHFDDINIPLYHGHVHEHPDEEPGEVNVHEPILPESTGTGASVHAIPDRTTTVNH